MFPLVQEALLYSPKIKWHVIYVIHIHTDNM